ncbi:MAG: tetratricopeptide repeat-containing sensor histidine kinase [Bacteroidia bacterium]|nr:tetratricopeptide repeat-containing sensor histidine kinase [Bacteroidia bacterium]
MSRLRLRDFVIFISIILFYSNNGYSANKEQSLIDSMLQVCISHLDNHENEAAFSTMQEIDNLIPLERNAFTIADYYSIKSAIEGRKKNFTNQFELLEKFKEQVENLYSPDYLAKSLLGFASYYEQFGDFKQALPFFLKALDQYKTLNNEEQIAYLYNKLGLIYYQDDDYISAKNYFMAAFVLFSKHKNEKVTNAYWMQNTLTNIGLCYKNLKLYRKALTYYFIALEFCKNAPFKKERAICVIHSNIGVLYGDLKEYAKAFYHLKLGIEGCIDPKNEELNHGVESMIYLASLYRKRGMFNEAEKQLERAKELILKEKLNYPMLPYYLGLSHLFYQKKDFKQAYLYKEKYLYLNDSIDNIEKKSLYGKQFLTHELESQKMKNEILERENDYQNLEMRGIIGLVLIAIIFITFTYRNLLKVRIHNKELTLLNEQVLEQKSKLHTINRQLEKLNINKSYLMQSVAHDLRTPIGNVISLNGLLEAEAEEGTEEREFHHLIQNSCLLSLNIIEDILDQTMIENGKFQLRKQDANIIRLLDESVRILEFRAKAKSISIVKNYGQLPELHIDSDRIKRVFINILMNAIKFSPKGAKIEINEYVDSKKCIVSIKDEGIGINEQMLSQIFDKYSEASRPGTENEVTIGIGLSITRSIVEGHGGHIKVESKPNYGSTFYIELPILESNAV